jgi:hypothetical protein
MDELLETDFAVAEKDRLYPRKKGNCVLQVMVRNRRQGVGPPFRKIGRLVRYPEQGLQEYINGK